MVVEKTLFGIGLMSGSSLDGLDIAYSQYDLVYDSQESKLLSLNHKLHSSACYSFPSDLVELLRQPDKLELSKLMKLDVDFGVFSAEAILKFIERFNLSRPDYIASHGHTVLHKPEDGFSLQIGSAAHIAALTGVKTIADFRSTDLAYQGQGAPMAPLVDKYLFKEADLFLNIGGIANISFQSEGTSIGYDIAPANQFLNRLAEQRGQDFDDKGKLAASGEVDQFLLDQLIQTSFFQSAAPKSLDNVYLREKLWPIINAYPASIETKLATCVELITITFRKALWHYQSNRRVQDIQKPIRLFASGGGAKNEFLMQKLLNADPAIQIDLLDTREDLIDMKEAILMSLAGALRLLEIPNLLSSVTGATKNSTGGAIYLSS